MDFSPFHPTNLITTMIYTLAVLALVNLLLGLIPEPDSAESKSAEMEPEARGLNIADFVVGAITKLGEKYE